MTSSAVTPLGTAIISSQKNVDVELYVAGKVAGWKRVNLTLEGEPCHILLESTVRRALREGMTVPLEQDELKKIDQVVIR